MKTNVGIYLTDSQRKLLAGRLGRHRSSKAPLATREEINWFVRKLVDHALKEVIIEERDPDRSNITPSAGDDWFDEYLMETCNAVFGE